MTLKHVVEPLDSPQNTIEKLICEIWSQTIELSNPMPCTPDPAEDFKKRVKNLADGFKIYKQLKDEILRRFEELEQKTKTAEQASNEKSEVILGMARRHAPDTIAVATTKRCHANEPVDGEPGEAD